MFLGRNLFTVSVVILAMTLGSDLKAVENCQIKQSEGFGRLLSFVGYDPLAEKRDRCRMLKKLDRERRQVDQAYFNSSISDDAFRVDPIIGKKRLSGLPIDKINNGLVVYQQQDGGREIENDAIDYVRGYENLSN